MIETLNVVKDKVKEKKAGRRLTEKPLIDLRPKRQTFAGRHRDQSLGLQRGKRLPAKSLFLTDAERRSLTDWSDTYDYDTDSSDDYTSDSSSSSGTDYSTGTATTTG